MSLSSLQKKKINNAQYCFIWLNILNKHNRYREKEKEPSTNKNHELQKHYQQINSHHRNFEEILERDHGLPTSAPNADILKTNSNPVYPNPNRHHNHERHHGGGPTPSSGVHQVPGGSKYSA